MTLQIVTYTYLNAPEALAEVRPEHRAFLGGLAGQGVVVASGPWVDEEPAGALLLLRTDSASAALEVLADDPFQREGLVLDVSVREWNPVIGVLAN